MMSLFADPPPPPLVYHIFSPQYRQYGALFEDNSKHNWNLNTELSSMYYYLVNLFIHCFFPLKNHAFWTFRGDVTF